MNTIGERLAYTRTTVLSMNQTSFAKLLGVSQGALSEMENNRRGLSMESIIKLMEYSKEDNSISCMWILTGEYENNKCSDLNNDEKELITTYNKLDRRGQHRVHTIIYEELDRIESQINKASTDSQGTYLYSSRHEEPTCIVCEDTNVYNAGLVHSISVLGYVAAGEPILSYENNINTIVPESSKASYALIAKGNSMEPIIMDGEIIEVISQKELENGEIGIIKVDNAVTCKCFYSLDCDYELKSLNPNNDPIIIEKDHCSNVQIVGKVALTIHQQERYNSLYKKVK